MKRFLLGLLLLLVSCGSPELRSPAPTPQAVVVFFPSTMKFWAYRMSACSAGNPLLGLYFNPSLDNPITDSVISLYPGEPPQIDQTSYLSQIGWEQIVVIVNRKNDLSQLSTEEIQSIFSGETQKWGEDASRLIQVWVLPDDDPIRVLFDHQVLETNLLTPEAKLAPDAQAMLEAIATNTTAIGYLPESVLSSGSAAWVSEVKTVQLEPSLKEKLHPPVIAVTQSEPEGLVRDLLNCVQAGVP